MQIQDKVWQIWDLKKSEKDPLFIFAGLKVFSFSGVSDGSSFNAEILYLHSRKAVSLDPDLIKS